MMLRLSGVLRENNIMNSKGFSVKEVRVIEGVKR